MCILFLTYIGVNYPSEFRIQTLKSKHCLPQEWSMPRCQLETLLTQSQAVVSLLLCQIMIVWTCLVVCPFKLYASFFLI